MKFKAIVTAVSLTSLVVLAGCATPFPPSATTSTL